MAFTPFAESDQPTMAAFNKKFQLLLSDAISSDIKIIRGSYIGTGTFGEANANSLTFESPPIFVMIPFNKLTDSNISSAYTSSAWLMSSDVLTTTFKSNVGFGLTSDGTRYGKRSEDGKTFSWYHNSNALRQLNESGYTLLFGIFKVR